YQHLEELTPARLQKTLADHREQAFRNRHLVTIVTDLPIDLDLQCCRTDRLDWQQPVGLFRDLEFRSLVERLTAPPKTGGAAQQLSFIASPEPPAPATSAEANANYETVTTPKGLAALVARLKPGPFALDTETDSTDSLQARLVGISLASGPGQAAYIPIAHASGQQLPWELVHRALAPLFADPEIPKVAQNAKYDLQILARHDLPVQGVAFDTMVAEWLCDPNSKNLGLKNMAWARLGVEMTPIAHLLGVGRAQVTMDQVPLDQAAAYAAADADMTLRLVSPLKEELEEKGLLPLYNEVELPLVEVLTEMERNGIGLDVPYLGQMADELQERLHSLEARIYDLAGYAFNINSPSQLSEALFDRLGLPKQGLRKTQSGHYSTAADVLERLKGTHPVVDVILEHRQVAKIKSTYVEALPALVNSETGRLHTSYNQTGTVTGRLSSSEPNLQNIPIRTELGRRVRRAFVADRGCLFISADYSQVELRILAHISQDRNLLAAFSRGEDIHASTAAAIYGVPLEGVTSEMRRVAKTVNFAVVYGASGFGVAQQSELSPEEGARFIDAYYRTYPQVRQYIESTKTMAREKGYVQTLLGRHRYFPEL
ncbi:MAG: DNA polymerase I, partial [Chloroflexi bacterium]|nr:DNA polymerase I [Chloroflexota bacterium]